MEAVRGQGLGKAAALLSEARDLGLVEGERTPEEWEEVVVLLRQALHVSPEEEWTGRSVITGGREYDRLLVERTELTESYRRAKEELEAAEGLMLEERGYSNEVGEQSARLRSIGVLPGSQADPLCPLCSQPTGESIPSLDEIRTAVEETASQLARVRQHSPQLQFVVDDLRDRVESRRRRIAENAEALSAVQKSSDRLAQLRDLAARRALVISRISLFLESLPEIEDSSALRQEIAGLKAQVELLEYELGEERIAERLDSILSLVSRRMSDWARELQLEHSEYPLRLDLRRLTVVADTDDGPLPMYRMGSGENWVGYHLIAHMALHEWFTKRVRPVPRFLFLDQPSQVYFPPEKDVADGSLDMVTEDDRVAVARMFRLIFDFVEGLAPGLQVIMTEHAELKEPWYQEAIVERWRRGRKLIPGSWYPDGASESD